MNNQTFLFAWSQYVSDNSKLGFKFVYYAVRADHSIFTSENWEEFYSITKLYCDKPKQLFCNGYLSKNKDIELFEHASFLTPFYTSDNKIVPVSESEITYYDYEADNEAPYFRNHCAYVG